MKITLDRVALKALVDADPEFELELKSAVLSELGRRFFAKDAARIIREAEPQLFDQCVKALQRDEDAREMISRVLRNQVTERIGYNHIQIKPAVLKELNEHVEVRKANVILSAETEISKAFSDAIAKAVEAKINDSDIEERIEKRVNRLVDQEIDRRAQDKFETRMADIKAMMS